MLNTTDICLKLDGKPVLHKVNVQLQEGEFVGLIGPNGAGKTSLLRILAGLLRADSGKVYMRGDDHSLRDLTKVPSLERAKKMAYLAQQEPPAWPLMVEHLVGLGRAPWHQPMGRKSAADQQAIERALHLTELEHVRQRPVTSLSGGELQRCLLARVFAGEPNIILADEPIAALDPYHQLHMMELLQAHATQSGGVVAALHDLGLAARYCQRLILLNDGQVIADGEPARVLTEKNLREVYGISAHIDCRDEGVVIIPKARIRRDA